MKIVYYEVFSFKCSTVCSRELDNDTSSACHLKMRGDRKIDRLTQGRQSIMIDYYWTVSNVNCKPTTSSITPH